MPTYDYECGHCGHEFELFQSITAPVKRKCPECSKLKLRRLIGPGAAIVFKGSGFYKTDYRSESYQKGAAAAKSSKSSSSDKSSKKGSAKASKAKTADAGDKAWCGKAFSRESTCLPESGNGLPHQAA